MGEQHLDYLDGWRGLAITFLLIGHFFPVPGINFGTVGVNLFFVLSGLLMARILFIKNVPIDVFYKRRISRIFPALAFFLLSIMLFYAVTERELNWAEFGTAAFLINNYFPGHPGNAVMPFGHVWSLSVEEHSYILLSAIAVASRKKIINARVATGACALLFGLIGGWYWLQHSGQELYRLWLHTEVSGFGIFASGFLLVWLHKRDIPRLPIVVYPALFALALAMHWWVVPHPIRTVIGVGALALLVNILVQAPLLIQKALSWLPLRQLGIWSYSIYVWQQPFYLYVHRDGMPTWIAFISAITAGITSFYLVEKPVRAYLNRAWTRESPIGGISKQLSS